MVDLNEELRCDEHQTPCYCKWASFVGHRGEEPDVPATCHVVACPPWETATLTILEP